MVLRDDLGAVIFSSCRYLRSCYSPLEAELAACLEGIPLALAHTKKDLVIELDCKEGVEQLNCEGINRSSVAGLVDEAKRLLHGVRQHRFVHAERSCNPPHIAWHNWDDARSVQLFGLARGRMIYVRFVKTCVATFIN